MILIVITDTMIGILISRSTNALVNMIKLHAYIIMISELQLCDITSIVVKLNVCLQKFTNNKVK